MSASCDPAGARSLQIVNLDQRDTDTTTLTRDDSGELAGRKLVGKDAGFICVG